jgi:hypothetical protein
LDEAKGGEMSSVYVSYRNSEQPFVRAVMSQLEDRHDIRIDYKIRPGTDWRTYQHDELRRSDVFLIFVSKDTHGSDYQNVEIGAARFSSDFVDGKLILPVLIDDVQTPRTIKDLDYLDLRHRDATRAAREIADALARRPRVRLFISHSHRDEDLAARLVEALTANLEIPSGELRCTSVPGYQLELGTKAPDVLRRELGSAVAVIALLTPNSLAAEWVHFELGAAWANAKLPIPLLVGDLEDKHIPGPFRGAAGAQLALPVTLDRLIDQLHRELHWPRKTDLSGLPGRQKQYELVEYVKKITFVRDPIEIELNATFAAKRARIGGNQGQVLDYVTARLGNRPYIPVAELYKQFESMETTIHYRLEQLRLLGFLQRTQIDESRGEPVWGWSLSEKYRRELGLAM